MLRLRSLIVGSGLFSNAKGPSLNVVRNKTFFNNKDQETLWKTNTSVSSQGQKRGRAKGLPKRRNLNVYQRIGFGKSRMNWPGLTTDVMERRGKDKGPPVREIIRPMDDAVYGKYRDDMKEKFARVGGGRRKMRIPPLQRGWTGGGIRGKVFGPPVSESGAPIGDFETIVIESKIVAHMTKLYGRFRSNSLLVVTGNGNGLAGIGKHKSPANVKSNNPIKSATDKAGKKLMYVPRYEDRTVYHDFFTRYGSTRIYVKQKSPGYGVKAHRVIQAICRVVGIKDLYAKVEGGGGIQNITKAFFLGLLRQRSHRALADEMGLHLVEFRAENGNFPKLIASPESGYVRTKREILPNEILDFETISFEGHLPFYRPQPAPFYTRLPGWEVHLKRQEPYKHTKSRMLQLLIDEGAIKSHLTDKYPECLFAKDFFEEMQKSEASSEEGEELEEES